MCFFFFSFFLGLLLKAFQLQQPNFQCALTFSCMASFQVFIPQFLHVDHSLLSVSACSLLFSLLEDMVSCSLFPVLLRTPPRPSNHSHCLSGSHGPPTKAVGGGQWNNSWHPYGLHFPDRNAVTVLVCVSIRVTEQEKEKNQRGQRETERLNKTVLRKSRGMDTLLFHHKNCFS